MRERPLTDLDRPAVVASSPVPCSGPERRFGTLREALAHAGRNLEGEPSWIVTWSGAVLTPGEVTEMQGFAAPAPRPWARAGDLRRNA